MLEERSYYLWEKQTQWGNIGVKRVTEILKDGQIISTSYWRTVLTPGDDLDAIKIELDKVADSSEVINVAKSVHTPEVIAAYQNREGQ